MNVTNKPGTGFWIIAVIALLWNLMGVFQFLASTVMLDAMIAELPEEQVDLFTSTPMWNTIIFAIAVFSGIIASITMLLRKKITVALFGISLIAVLIVQGYWLLATESLEIMGPTAAIMPLLVIIVSIFLYFYNKGAARNGWLT